MKSMNPVVHFELPAGDSNRMTAFYEKSFGWQMQKMGEEMGNYVVVTTTRVDETGRPVTPGAINGGIFPVTTGMPPQHPSLVIAVEDIYLSAKQVAGNGGQLLGEPVNIPGVGMYVSFIDTEGNRLSILQPTMVSPGIAL